MEMGAAVAYQHTDGNRNHDGCNLVHGVKEEEWDCQIWWSHYLFRVTPCQAPGHTVPGTCEVMPLKFGSYK